VEEDDDDEAMEEVLWEEGMVDAEPVDVEMAEVGGKDEVVIGEGSDAVD